jgi:cytosine/adenosine deaminase-related metal-dependent hydrolase
LSAAQLTVAHNARSNMNNAVGYAPVAAFHNLAILGTDGIGGDMFAESRAAWFVARHERAGLAPADILGMLAAGARRASAALGVTLGRLEVGAAADLVITDYRPATPLTSENVVGHLLFGFTSRHVCSVIAGGQWRLRDRTVLGCAESDVRRAATDAALHLWERMALLA